MTSISIVSSSARTEYKCNECEIPIQPEQPYVRSNRNGGAIKIHLHCAIPLVQHGWIWCIRLPNGEDLDDDTTPERWNELLRYSVATT